MPYARNTDGTTTLDGILDVLSDLAVSANNAPYVSSTSGVTLSGLLAALQDKAASTSSAPYARNTDGVTLIDLALDAAAGIAGATSVAAFDPAPYGGLTLAAVVAGLTDIANATDSRPYTRNTDGTTTIDGILDALTDIVAAGGLGAFSPSLDFSDDRNSQYAPLI